MKSKILIAGAMLCAITTTGAHAVTKCVAFDSSTKCTSDYTQYQYHPDWASTCTANGVSTPISGIAICSSTESPYQFVTATELDISSTLDENLNCWCKMTSPAASRRWVFNTSYSSAGFCARGCATYCADRFQGIPAMRSAILGSLSD